MLTTVAQENITQSPFDSIKRYDQNGVEFWTARDFMKLLGYSKYERFQNAINKAKVSCKNAGNSCSEHFSPVSGKTNKAGRPLEEYYLTRFACYLTAMQYLSVKPVPSPNFGQEAWLKLLSFREEKSCRIS